MTFLVPAIRQRLANTNDPLEVLELVHAAADRLRELAGPAFVVTIAPAPTDRTGGGVVAAEAPTLPRVPRTVASGRAAEDAVRDFLRSHGGRACQSELSHELEVEKKRVYGALQRLGGRGEVRRTDQTCRRPGATSGRPSPVWELTEHEAAGRRETAAPREQGEAEAADRPTPNDPGLDRLAAAINAQAADTTPEPSTTRPEPDNAIQGETIDAPVGGVELDGHPDSLSVSRRTRRSIERAQAEERAALALGDPPPSRVFDLLRDRAMSVHQLAAALGESHVLIAEELHALKPWTIELPDGKRRAVERLRTRAA